MLTDSPRRYARREALIFFMEFIIDENTMWPNCDDLPVLASLRKHLTAVH